MYTKFEFFLTHIFKTYLICKINIELHYIYLHTPHRHNFLQFIEFITNFLNQILLFPQFYQYWSLPLKYLMPKIRLITVIISSKGSYDISEKLYFSSLIKD